VEHAGHDVSFIYFPSRQEIGRRYYAVSRGTTDIALELPRFALADHASARSDLLPHSGRAALGR